jgi:hypothetical protein
MAGCSVAVGAHLLEVAARWSDLRGFGPLPVATPADHNGAAFMAYPLGSGPVRGKQMRLILGIIIGCALTVGGAYVVDTMSPPAAGSKMVNWDVVAKNLDTVTTMAKEGWKKITG